MFNKLFSILKGENEEVHQTKKKYNVEMLNIHLKAKEQVRSSKDLVKIIENSTAYRIAKATGKLR